MKSGILVLYEQDTEKFMAYTHLSITELECIENYVLSGRNASYILPRMTRARATIYEVFHFFKAGACHCVRGRTYARCYKHWS